MNELSLFSGAGGGLLSTQHLLGWNTIGYVENDDYCQRVLAQRIKDGVLDNAPIFTDIRAFNDSGCARLYRGVTDVVSGGFPCQDLSCAGNGDGITGERSGLWFDMAETIRIIRPRYVFIENVTMLLVRGFEHVLGALFKMGFDAAWGIVSAADVGAPHLRKRLWIVAYSECMRRGEPTRNINSTRKPLYTTKREESTPWFRSSSKVVADAKCNGLQRAEPTGGKASKMQRRLAEPVWWAIEPDVGRVAHGVANRVDRLKTIGNGQVPAVVAEAWKRLAG